MALTGNYGSVNDVAFVPGTSLVVAGSRARDVQVWDAATGAPRDPLRGDAT